MTINQNVTLLDGLVKTQHASVNGGFSSESYMLGGEGYANAVVAAVIEDYDYGLPSFTDKQLSDYAGEQVTVLRAGENMFGAKSLVATPGKVFVSDRGLALLPKGKRTKGIILKDVIDFVLGYNVDALRVRVDHVRALFPQVTALAQEDLNALPANSNTCSLTLFGTWPGIQGESPCPGALWLCNEYDAENDIVQNVLIVRPETGTSEYGSCYGRDLLRWGVGKVEGFSGIPFKEAIDLSDKTYHEALAVVTGSVLASPAT